MYSASELLSGRLASMVGIASAYPVESISYTQFRKLKQCPLKGLYPRHLRLYPAGSIEVPSRSAALGMVLHRCLELISRLHAQKTADIGALCEESFAEIEAALILKYGARFRGLRSFPKAGTVFEAARRSVVTKHQTKSTASSSNGTNFLTEPRLTSIKGTLLGRPDLVIIKNGSAIIVEYKMSDLSSLSADVIEAHVDQLHVYAYLLKEQTGIYPDRVRLVGSDGESLSIVPSADRSSRLAREMNVLRDYVNRVINGHEQDLNALAWPSEHACGDCNLKPWCSGFREKSSQIRIPGTRHVLVGVQEGAWKGNRNIGTIIKVRPIYASFKTRAADISVTRVNSAWYESIKDSPGQVLLMTNLVAQDGALGASCTFESILSEVTDT